MARSRDASPEKRLLQIIEEQQDKPPAAYPRGLRRFVFSWQWAKQRRATGGFSIRQLNFVLKLTLAAAVALVGALVQHDWAQLNAQTITPPVLMLPVSEQNVEMRGILQSRTYYLEQVDKRDMFAFADVAQSPALFSEDTADKKPSLFRDMVNDLKLVGISWADEPEAIIEAERAQKTFFLKQGQSINDIEVREILKDRVVLRYQNETMELR